MKFTIAVFLVAAAQAVSLEHTSIIAETGAGDLVPSCMEGLAQTEASTETTAAAETDIIFGAILDLLC